MILASPIIFLSKILLWATYLVQAAQIFLISVPSAGSTLEMLSKVRGAGGPSQYHPASEVLKSKLKTGLLATATVMMMVIFFLPLAVEWAPGIADYLGRFYPQTPVSFRVASIILLCGGNLVSTLGACTLKKQVAFHAFGETRTLYAGGIYRRVRNPITLGSAAVYAGFFFYLPSVVLAVGFGIFALNSELRVRMEEIYLQRAFGDRYRHYKRTTGKYWPKIYS